MITPLEAEREAAEDRAIAFAMVALFLDLAVRRGLGGWVRSAGVWAYEISNELLIG
mgnify:CR=1 FL=1